jgi:hypothetical protein
MRKAITLGLAALALSLPLTYVVAGSRTPEPLPPMTPADAMPAYELFARLRMLELEPKGEPVRRGPYYILHAADSRGRVLRVVADAELGDILSIMPARAPVWRPQGPPRIIHIPDRADLSEARLKENGPDDVPADVVPEPRLPSSEHPAHKVRPPQRKADLPPQRLDTPRKPYSAAPSGPGTPEPSELERRNILSAPPPEARIPARDPLALPASALHTPAQQ